MERFQKNITKRGAVPETTTKKGNDFPVGPVLLGFFIFVVIGSCKDIFPVFSSILVYSLVTSVLIYWFIVFYNQMLFHGIQVIFVTRIDGFDLEDGFGEWI